MGYDADSVGDLARVLRVAGTLNRKLDRATGKALAPAPVRIVELDETRRYTVEALRQPLAAWTALEDYGRQLAAVDFPEDLPRVELESLRVKPWVKQLIRDGLRGPYRERFPTRSEAVFRVVVEMAEAQHRPEEIVAVLLDERYGISERHYVDAQGRQRKDPRAYVEEEVRRILAKCHLPAAEGPSTPESSWNPILLDGRLPIYQLTDTGNAYRLRNRHGERIRFCPGIGWLVWDGRRWARDEDLGRMRALAADTAVHILEEAKYLDE